MSAHLDDVVFAQPVEEVRGSLIAAGGVLAMSIQEKDVARFVTGEFDDIINRRRLGALPVCIGNEDKLTLVLTLKRKQSLLPVDVSAAGETPLQKAEARTGTGGASFQKLAACRTD